MPQIVLTMKSEKRTREIFTVDEFKERFLYGIKIQNNGRDLPDSTYQNFLDYAVEEVEKYLLVKLKLQIFTEDKNYHSSDWQERGQVKASYPVMCGLKMDGFIGTVRQVTFPREWISVKRTSEDLYSRLLHIIPNSGTGFNQTAGVYSGLYPQYGMIGGGQHTPNFWTISYITGFKKIPKDIEVAVGMLAAVNVLAVGNETLASALGTLGASSKSISIDGLSQSVSMYANGQAGIFGARIKQYGEALMDKDGKGLLQRLRDYYGAIVWTTC